MVSADLELMRAAALLDSDPAAAARKAGEVLAKWPGHAEASLLLAVACRALGDPAAAASLLESLAEKQAGSAVILMELGRAYAAGGRGAQAEALLRRAVALDANLADAWRELAARLHAAGDAVAGDVAYARYTSLVAEPPELSDAVVALADSRVAAAEALLRQRLQAAPRDTVAMRMLADALARRAETAEAERWLQACLALAPGYAAARYDLALLLYAQQKTRELLPHVERLLAAEPGNSKYLSLKASALRLAGRIEEALAIMARVVAARPDDGRMWILHGHLLRAAGRQAAAIDAYRHSLAVRPASGEAYWSLANLKTFRFASADLEAMRTQLADPTVRGLDRAHFEFALGKALEDDRQYSASFEHYAAGNAQQRALIDYDPQWTTADVRRWKAVLTREFFARRAGYGSDRKDPIFIVGLPRSGSTLLEQMLASHSAVDGTRELPEIGWIADGIAASAAAAGGPPYPQALVSLAPEQLRAFAERYLEQTREYRSHGRPRFIDKMLFNFGHVGLIHLMFPRASIIDARRHPLGCGFSCYKQLFTAGMPFSYDLAELGRYYRDYVDLMEHIDAVLPGRVHRVYYERLVADPEAELRALLDYCGLPFEAECLRFYENPRVVQTVSSEQVRQPIYVDSVDQWRHYESWLDPLKQALGDLVDRYPA
jgi:tetratricopeptide (TPR) repeat protein